MELIDDLLIRANELKERQLQTVFELSFVRTLSLETQNLLSELEGCK
jgi:hypothetical protein